MALKLGSLEFYAGPTVLGGPDDLDAVIRGFIDGTEHALYVAVQDWTPNRSPEPSSPRRPARSASS